MGPEKAIKRSNIQQRITIGSGKALGITEISLFTISLDAPSSQQHGFEFKGFTPKFPDSRHHTAGGFRTRNGLGDKLGGKLGEQTGRLTRRQAGRQTEQHGRQNPMGSNGRQWGGNGEAMRGNGRQWEAMRGNGRQGERRTHH